MNRIKVLFIGTGNMGGTLALAAAKGGCDLDILLCDHNKDKSEALKDTIAKQCEGTNVTVSICESINAAQDADYIFLGVKPQVFSRALDEIKDVLLERDDKFVLISMAAGLTIDTVLGMAGGDYPIIRIMPNLPAAVGKGTILYTANSKVGEGELKTFIKFMSGAGALVKFDEKLFDAGTSVSGCGPAFVYMFIDALARGGALCGIEEKDALRLAACTVEGAARMVIETGEDPDKLKTDVCSPGGSTIEGVKSLEKDKFYETVVNAVMASYEKNLSMK